MAKSATLGLDLEREMLKMRQEVDKWAAKQKEEVLQAETSHTSAMRVCKEKIRILKEKVAQAESKAVELDQRDGAAAKELRELKSELAALKMEEENLVPELEGMKTQTLKCEEELAHKVQSLERLKARNQNEQEKLLKSSELYRKLGLEFQKVQGGCLRLVFTQLNRSSPDQQYSITIKLNEAGLYEDVECSPALRDFPDLIEELNKSSNFSAFVRSVRRQFKRMAETTF